MARFYTRKITEYRLVCEAMWDDDGSGCSGNAPISATGHSETEAIELANQCGWEIVTDHNQNRIWACPAHVRGRENAEAAKDQSQY